MSRKRTKTSIKKACDKLWSKIIRETYPECVKCGKPTTEAHHVFGRKCMSTRYELDNGIGLCCYCHKFSPMGFEQDAHSKENLGIVINILGQERYDKLEAQHYTIKKFTMEELLEIEKGFKLILEIHE